MTWITYTTEYIYVDLTDGEIIYMGDKALKDETIIVIRTEKNTVYGKAKRHTTITKYIRRKPQQQQLQL